MSLSESSHCRSWHDGDRCKEVQVDILTGKTLVVAGRLTSWWSKLVPAGAAVLAGGHWTSQDIFTLATVGQLLLLLTIITRLPAETVCCHSHHQNHGDLLDCCAWMNFRVWNTDVCLVNSRTKRNIGMNIRRWWSSDCSSEQDMNGSKQ